MATTQLWHWQTVYKKYGTFIWTLVSSRIVNDTGYTTDVYGTGTMMWPKSTQFILALVDKQY